MITSTSDLKKAKEDFSDAQASHDQQFNAEKNNRKTQFFGLKNTMIKATREFLSKANKDFSSQKQQFDVF